MGRFTVLLGVLALMSYAIVSLPYGDPAQHLVDVAEIANKQQVGLAAVRAQSTDAASVATRTFSPERPLFATDAEPERASSRLVDHSSAAHPRAAISVSRVTGNDVSDANEHIVPRSQQGGADRLTRARQLQSVLKTAGCYWGDVDGDWGPGSRRAMRQYMRAVNSTLPVDEPDEILLRLVNRHRVESCMPPTIIAGARRQEIGSPPTPRIIARQSQWATTLVEPPVVPDAREVPASATVQRPPLPGRMAIGAPPNEPILQTGPSLARPLPQLNGTRAARGRRSPAELAAVDRRQNGTLSSDVRQDGNVIVYRPSIRAAAARPSRKPPRRQTRRPRDIYETNWARQAFRSGD